MRDLEHIEQVHVFRWAKTHPELRFMLAIPNGGFRHKTTAARLKAEGVKAGVPDIALLIARRGYHGLLIELKTKANKILKVAKGRLSDSQKAYLEELNKQGYKTAVCYGADEAIQVIKEYMDI